MASKKRTKKSYASGKSTAQLLRMHQKTFEKLTEPEMRKVVSKMALTANQRLSKFEKAGESSPATRFVMQKSLGKFSTMTKEGKRKNLNQLRSEYMRIKSFMNSKTSTLRGWHGVKHDTIESLSTKGVDMTGEQFDDFWKIYEKIKEMDPRVKQKEVKYGVLEEIEVELTARQKEIDDAMQAAAERGEALDEDDMMVDAGAIALKIKAKINDIAEEQANENAKSEKRGTSKFMEKYRKIR